jgi:hypothetical protein
MDVYPKDHCPEGKMVITTELKLLQTIVVMGRLQWKYPEQEKTIKLK